MGAKHSKFMQVLELEKDSLAKEVEKMQYRVKKSISTESKGQLHLYFYIIILNIGT